MSTDQLLMIGAAIAFICGCISAIIASDNGRDWLGYFLLGCLLGVLGVIITAIVGPVRPVGPPPGWYAINGGMRYWDGQAWR